MKLLEDHVYPGPNECVSRESCHVINTLYEYHAVNVPLLGSTSLNLSALYTPAPLCFNKNVIATV